MIEDDLSAGALPAASKRQDGAIARSPQATGPGASRATATHDGVHERHGHGIAHDRERTTGKLVGEPLPMPPQSRSRMIAARWPRRAPPCQARLDNLRRPIKVAKKTVKPTADKASEPFKRVTSTKGLSEAAILDWETWGHKDPARFFRLWSELDSGGFSPSG